MPKEFDTPTSRDISLVLADNVREDLPKGAEMELVLRRHGDKTGNYFASKNNYSASKKEVLDE